MKVKVKNGKAQITFEPSELQGVVDALKLSKTYCEMNDSKDEKYSSFCYLERVLSVPNRAIN